MSLYQEFLLEISLRMNNTTDTDEPTFAENLLAAATMFTLSGIGLTAYLLVIVTICWRFSEFRNSFYPLILSLAISDSIMLALFFFYSAPATLLQFAFLGPTVDILFGALCNMVYFAGLTCVCFISLNRYWAVCRFDTYKLIFTHRMVKGSLIFIWLTDLASCIPQLTPCCYLHYYPSDYTWGYDMSLAGNRRYIWYDRFMNVVTFLSIVIAYSLITAKRRKQKKKVANNAVSEEKATQDRAAEYRLVLQFAIVAIVLIVFGLGFTIIPELTVYRWGLFCTSLLYIINNSVNPFVYIYFNEKIQQEMRFVLTGKRQAETQPMAILNTGVTNARPGQE